MKYSKKYIRYRFFFDVFWCTKNVKFHFQWGTKPRDQKQETGYDCDVISGLQASRKTAFSVILLLWTNKVAKKMVQKCVVYKKIRKCRRNLFSAKLEVLKWRHNHSQSPVYGLAVLYPTGIEISRFWYIKTRGRKMAGYWICCFAILSSILWRFCRANKKKSVIYTVFSRVNG